MAQIKRHKNPLQSFISFFRLYQKFKPVSCSPRRKQAFFTSSLSQTPNRIGDRLFYLLLIVALIAYPDTLQSRLLSPFCEFFKKFPRRITGNCIFLKIVFIPCDDAVYPHLTRPQCTAQHPQSHSSPGQTLYLCPFL